MTNCNNRITRLQKYLYLISFLLISILNTTPTFAQQYLIDVQHLTPENGLGNLLTTSIIKDSKGFMWIATKYGLNRYDGYTYKLYTKENNGLHDDRNIYRIEEDEQGNLWLFYANSNRKDPAKIETYGISVFDPKTEKAISFEAFIGNNQPFEVTDIKATQVDDPQKRIWVTTKKGQLYLYHQGGFEKIFEKKGLYFSHITIDRKGLIWVGAEKRLLCINRFGELLNQLPLPGQVKGIWIGKENEIWAAALKPHQTYEELTFWVKHQGIEKLESFEFPQQTDLFKLYNKKIFIHRSRKGYWLFNTSSPAIKDNPLYLFNDKGERVFELQGSSENDINSMITNFYEDENNIWLTSLSGVFKLKASRNPFQLIHKKEELSDCRGITEDGNGNIYFLNGPVFQWNPKSQQVLQCSENTGAYALTYTDSLLWASSYSDKSPGFQIDLKAGREKNINNKSKQGPTYALLPTKKPGHFLMGRANGLAELDIYNNTITRFTKFNNFEALRSSTVYHIYKNDLGIWLATDKGIFLMNEKEGVTRHFCQSNQDLPFNHIRYIYEDPDTTEGCVFWLATYGAGIFKWKPSLNKSNTSTFKQFSSADGLSNDYTYAIYEDDFGYLWIPSDQGLMQMNKKTFDITTHLTEDGLPHNEFNLAAHYQAKDGSFYFGGLGGLVSFHPKVFAHKNSHQTPLEFIGFHLLEKDADNIVDKTDLLYSSDEVIIKPTDKLFELQFSMMDYDNPEHHNFAYQIEGYDERWQYIKDNYLRITNLPYGRYQLRVKGLNINKGWSDQELSLSIRVLKPFYLQWWFLTLLILTSIGLLMAFVKRRELTLKADRQRLEKEVVKRTRRIEEDKQVIIRQAEALKELDKAKTHFFSNITHELRTPLTLIIGPLEQLFSDQRMPAFFQRRIKGVIKNGKHLLNLINQMLDLSKIESGRMQIDAMRGDIVFFTKELVGQFQSLADKKEQQLIFTSDLESWIIDFDKDKWQKIIYNLLSNAVKFTNQNGSIELRLHKIQNEEKDQQIQLLVKDNGIGISKENLKQIFNRFYQADYTSTRQKEGTGIGLALVKELVELQGGKISVESEIDKGTSFLIHLPELKNEHLNALSTETLAPPPLLTSIESVVNASSPEKAASSLKHKKLELLLIEDNEEIREYIRYCIDDNLYHIAEASNGEEGIQKAFEMIPDLIISDIMMPEKDGFEVTEAIRNNIATSHIPLILLTAKASLESRLEGLQRGADVYLTKPFSPKELAIRVEKLISVRQLLQERYRNGIPKTNDKGYQKEDEFIVRLRNFIQENIESEQLNGDFIGQHFYITRVHLYRKLKALTNQSISEFVRNIRLKKAMELLQEGKLNISEVSYKTGFSSLSHFSRTFKKVYGKAPSEI